MMFFLKFLKGWQLFAIVGAACFTVGGWTVHKLHKAADAGVYKQIIEQERKAHEQALVSERTLFNKKLEIARSQIKVKEVIRYVKDNPDCDIPPTTSGLLEAHRQGLQATGSITGDTRTTPESENISQSQEIAGHFDIADRFIECRQQIIELNRYYAVTN